MSFWEIIELLIMPKFTELGFGGGELTCRLCSSKVFYPDFNRFRNSDIVEFEWGYQCQNCGELKMSKEQYDDRPYLLERCYCGGQFRRDKNLFCKNCKGNKTEENISDDFIKFKDVNGEPILIKHKTSDERIGLRMTKEELHDFGVNILAKHFKTQGQIIIDTNSSLNREYPNIIFKSVNEKFYYLIVETTAYPTTPESLFRNDFPHIVHMANFCSGIPVFAGMSFANLVNKNCDFSEMICGDSYAIAFNKLYFLT